MKNSYSPALSKAHTSHTAAGRAGNESCPCGCASCPETGCGLDCLVQPRFYCGQLLTDADLTALLTWAQEKFRLRRYLDGWGVVCGLAVHCDPARSAGVVVTPGYARDCCGNDVVICDEVRIDLSQACPKPECLDPYREWEEPSGTTGDVSAYGGGLLDELLKDNTAVDLYLHYDEVGSQPQAAIARNACGERGACENSRTRESYRLTWTAVARDANPQAALAASWLATYQQAMKQALSFAQSLRDMGDVAQAQQALLDWLAHHPLSSLCGLGAYIRETGAEALRDQLGKWLFWIMIDYRAAWLRCDCVPCAGELGIPLARVWLSGKTCRVQAISPYRRGLQPFVCLPAPPDHFNLGRVIGEDRLRASELLAGAGLQVMHEGTAVTPGWEALRPILESEATTNLLFAGTGDRYKAYYVNGGDFGGERLAWLAAD